MSLTARHLEANGIATVIIGSARDIVVHCGVPRFVFTDFPLGNPCGEPFNPEMQRQVVRSAIDLLAEASQPRSIVELAFRWRDDDWRERYMEIRAQDRAELAQRGAELRARREKLKAEGRTRSE